MIFSFIMIVVIAGVGFFHYIQGFFSATISAIITILASAMALSYFENLTALMLRGKMADQAFAITICCIFAGTYIVLRLIIDKLVPGNIRLPVIADKVGAGVMGVIAGLFVAGTLAVAAQSLPFAPSIGGYSRYETFDREDFSISIPGLPRRQEVSIYEEMKADTFADAKVNSLWVPVDDLVVGLVTRLSQGSMSGGNDFERVHPDFLHELFANRLGIQVGAKRSMLNRESDQQAKLEGAYQVRRASVVDSDLAEIRTSRKVPAEVVATPSDLLLVLRVTFSNSAAEASDRLVRLSPASVRLVANKKNYHPIGTMEGSILYANKVDDFIFVDCRDKDHSADFVFQVPYEEVATSTQDPNRPDVLAGGLFLEIKRFARIDLSEVSVTKTPPATGEAKIIRKPGIQMNLVAQAIEAASKTAGFEVKDVKVIDRFFIEVAVNTPDASVDRLELADGAALASMNKRKFSKLEMLKPVNMATLQTGTQPISEMQVPDGKHIVQVIGVPPAKGGTDPWSWALNLNRFSVVDKDGKKYSASGAWSKVKVEGVDHVIAAYNMDGRLPRFKLEDGRPTENTIAFLVPSGTTIEKVVYDDLVLQNASFVIP